MRQLRLAKYIQVAAGSFTEEGGHDGGSSCSSSARARPRSSPPTTWRRSGRSTRSRSGACACPDDVSLVGYDNTSLAALRHISLTTVHQPRLEMGQMAVSILMERLEESRTRPRRAVLTPSLVVRGTTAPPPDPARS